MAVVTNIDLVPTSVLLRGNFWTLPGVPAPTNAQMLAAVNDPARWDSPPPAAGPDSNQIQTNSDAAGIHRFGLAPQASLAGRILTRLDLAAYIDIERAPTRSQGTVRLVRPGAAAIAAVSDFGATGAHDGTSAGQWYLAQITDLAVLGDLVLTGDVNNLYAQVEAEVPALGMVAVDAIYARAVTVPGYELSGAITPRPTIPSTDATAVYGLQGTI